MSLLKKLKASLALIGLKPSSKVTSELVKTTQEDPRDIEAVKRVQKQFEDNWELIQARASIPHGFDCQDNLLCEKENCWEWQPDKIVGESYVVTTKKNKKT